MVCTIDRTCTGIVLGLIVRRVRRVKWFAVAGTCLFMTAFGILLRFRGSGGPSDVPGLIGGQFLLGLAGGLFAYPTQALVQAATRHEHVAVITSLYLATYNVGSSIGYRCVKTFSRILRPASTDDVRRFALLCSISGAVWTQRMPRLLVERLAGINPALAISVYEDPYTFAGEYAWGTPERDAVVSAYGEGQRLLVIMGLCLVSTSSLSQVSSSLLRSEGADYDAR
jgi:SIT family siderophore-iron:H+ symporter-like MFS transporter